MNSNNPLESTLETTDQEAQWISLSDLMTGLMMLFLLIAVAFMLKVEADNAKIREVAVLYDQVRQNLRSELAQEFKDDLPKWGAEITNDLAIRFKDPEVLFKTGDDALNGKFEEILNDFFPRYLKILTSDKYKGVVAEVRIEGHTSSAWQGAKSPEDAYFRNMALSQSRTRSTLHYLMDLPDAQQDANWLRKYVTANGLSSSHPILNEDGSEDMARSQRVEFRIRTDADARIVKILESIK